MSKSKSKRRLDKSSEKSRIGIFQMRKLNKWKILSKKCKNSRSSKKESINKKLRDREIEEKCHNSQG